MATSEDRGKQKIAFFHRLSREKRYDDFTAKLKEYQSREDCSPNSCWLHAARHFPPLDGSPHEISELPDPLPPLPGEIPEVVGFVDDAPPAEKYVASPPEPDDEPFIDGEDFDLGDLGDSSDPAPEPPKPKGKGKPKKNVRPKPKPDTEPTDEDEPRRTRPAAPHRDDDPAGDPEKPDYGDLDPDDVKLELKIFSRLHKAVPKTKKAKPVEMIEWVLENLDEPAEDIHPADIPSRSALSLLRTTRFSIKARSDFIDKHWQKLIPTKTDMGNVGASGDDHHTQSDLMDRFERNYFDRDERDKKGEDGDSELPDDETEPDGSDS